MTPLEMREPLANHFNWLRGRDGFRSMTNEVTQYPRAKKSSQELEIGSVDSRSGAPSADLRAEIRPAPGSARGSIGTFCALYSDLAGCPNPLLRCVLIQRLDWPSYFADANCHNPFRTIQAEHLSNLISVRRLKFLPQQTVVDLDTMARFTCAKQQ